MGDEQDREIRLVPLSEMEIRHSGRATEGFTIRGYPAVYNETSLNLGGFREQIAPGAFDEVLATNPDVHFVWDHDTRYVGARTTNDTLHLSSDDHGLFMDAQVGNYTWAKDLRTALERGDIDQGSFSFSIAEDGAEMSIDENDQVLQRVNNVSNLFDVTVTAKGAYPQTSLAVARSLAVVTGRPPEEVEAALVAPEEGQREEEEPNRELVILIEGLQKRANVRRARLAELAKRMEKL